MVQNKIKGTDLASICLERWFFFFFKEALDCIIFQSMNYTFLPGKKKWPFKFNIRNFSKNFLWLPIACGNRSQFLNWTWETLYDLSLSCPPCLSPGHIPPHTPYTPHCSLLPAILLPKLVSCFCKALCLRRCHFLPGIPFPLSPSFRS